MQQLSPMSLYFKSLTAILISLTQAEQVIQASDNSICIMPDHLHVILQVMALCLMTLDFSPGDRDTLAKMRLSNTGTGIPHRE